MNECPPYEEGRLPTNSSLQANNRARPNFNATMASLSFAHHETALLALFLFNQERMPANNEFEDETDKLHAPPAEGAFSSLVAASVSNQEGGEQERVDDVAQRSQRVLIISPSPTDVIFGKGNRLAHSGNIRYRAECRRLLPRFLAKASSEVKEQVALEINDFVYQQGGRFLEDEGSPGEWRIASFELALKKTKQLLADAKKADDELKQSSRKRERSQISSGEEDEKGDEGGAHKGRNLN